MTSKSLLSVAVPLFNEAAGIRLFHDALVKQLASLNANFEIIYCDDGSSDETGAIVSQLCKDNKQYKLVSLSRNFGKEYALAAAINAATGDAVILIDGDGQHPISAIPQFYKTWQQGAQVVIGRRTGDDTEARLKRSLSRWFYRFFGSLSGQTLDPLATDYRLLDREVVTAYQQLQETDRLNRLLIDWLGFTRSYVPIDRHARIAGTASYSLGKLFRLALDTLVSSSPRPLYALSLFGVVITGLSFVVGIVIGIEQFLFNDPLAWNFTGTALLGILLTFLVGIVLTAQGIVSLYVATVHNQVKRRPLYVINQRTSVNIERKSK